MARKPPSLESHLLRPILAWAASWLAVADTWEQFCTEEILDDAEAVAAESMAYDRMLKHIEAQRGAILAFARQFERETHDAHPEI